MRNEDPVDDIIITPSEEARYKLLRVAREYAASVLLSTLPERKVEQRLLLSAIDYTKKLQAEAEDKRIKRQAEALVRSHMSAYAGEARPKRRASKPPKTRTRTRKRG